MHWRAMGAEAVLVECADLAEVMARRAAVAADPPRGVVDLVPAARTLLVTFDRQVTDHARLAAAVQATGRSTQEPCAPTTLTIPVRYDGADLAEVAGLTGLSPQEVVRRHLAAGYTVAFVGFAPGFGYLTGGDPTLTVPRRSTPRTRVPAGSVALADSYTGLYPHEGPGGWQLIGRTDAPLWDVRRDPPAVLVPGARVRFVEATA